MSSPVPVVDGQPVTWEQYLALPEDPRVEFVGGRLRVRPRPSRRHQQVVLATAAALRESVPPGYEVAVVWAWKAGADEFIPDVMVHPVTADDDRFTGVPALVVEVLADEAAEDLTLLRDRYAAAGLAHLWVVNPASRSLEVLADGPGGLAVRRQFAVADGQVEVSFGVGAVRLDLPALL